MGVLICLARQSGFGATRKTTVSNVEGADSLDFYTPTTSSVRGLHFYGLDIRNFMHSVV